MENAKYRTIIKNGTKSVRVPVCCIELDVAVLDQILAKEFPDVERALLKISFKNLLHSYLTILGPC